MTDRSTLMRKLALLAVLTLTALEAYGTICPLQRVLAQAEQVEAKTEQPTVGLLVTRVDRGSPAERAGLREGDLLTRYGTLTVFDGASYHAARADYLKRAAPQVDLLLWRAGKPMTLAVPKGRLGFHSRDVSSVRDELYGALQRGEPAQAKELLARAAKAQTLTPAQLLIANILLIPDRATPEEEARRAVLLQEFLSAYPLDFVGAVSYDEFYQLKRFTAASACFERQLKEDPTNESTWLNLGNAYNSLWRFADADRAAEYVITHRLPLSTYGRGVLYQVKGGAALGLGDYPRALESYQKTFTINPTDHKIEMWLLAAALLGDGPKFAEIAAQCREALPDQYARLRHHIDALEAYLLVKNNEREKAQALLARWKQTPRLGQNIAEYWPRFPRGAEIVANWKVLLQE